MFRLDGKVAIITGGASGIGAATAARFTEAGATCLIVDVTAPADTELPDRATAHVCDVTNATDLQAVVAEAVDRHGALDIMVNNAGVLGPGQGIATDSVDDGRSVLEVNLIGVLNGMKAAVAVMQPGSVIINTASMAGVVGFPGIAWYGASKWGVVGVTKHGAVEFGPRGIRVNCVCPTGVVTPGFAPEDAADHWAVRTQSLANQHVNRLATADEVAAAIHFLASDDAMMVNGHALHVDGGLAAGPSTQMIEAALGESIQDDGAIRE